MQGNTTHDATKLADTIKILKAERNACVVAHYYQSGDVCRLADFVGDSLDLARYARKATTEVIVVAGVVFMAEMVKVMTPERMVLLANAEAKCEMADMISAEDVRGLRRKFPGIPIVAYINTSAAVKAEADICCTSKNAREIVQRINGDEVVFVPDQNVADYVGQSTSKSILKFPGYCYVHKEMSAQTIAVQRERHPAARVLAHPECPREILDRADVVESTGGMLAHVSRAVDHEYIVATEEGFVDELRRRFPQKQFYSLNHVCGGMKKTSVHDIVNSLEKKRFQIELPEEIVQRARKSMERMFALSPTQPHYD